MPLDARRSHIFSPDRLPRRENDSVFLGILLLLVLAVYFRVSRHGFINYDDPLYITANRVVQAGLTVEGIRWAFTSFHAYNWHPLTWLSHMLDVQCFGVDPAWHHLVNLLFHLANTFLLYVVLKRMTGAVWRSLCVAALFALHPLHVESVAWVAERKDVLSGFFWLLTLLAYLRYADAPDRKRYAFVAVSFAFGLMAKPMLVTLPFVLLLLDWWPLGRTGRTPASSLILEKAPLLALSLGSGIVTYIAQLKGGALATSGHWTFAARAANVSLAYAAYLGKALWPVQLSVFYPLPPGPVPYGAAIAAAIVLLLVSFLAIRAARKSPWLAVGWFWFLGTLVPVIGVVRIGAHAIADRYTYLPLIGLFIAFAWGAADLAERLRLGRKQLVPAAIALFGALSVASFLQIGHWRDNLTLYTHALEVTGNNWLAHKNLATALVERGELPQALVHVRESVRLRPDPTGYVSMGWIYAQLGEFERSIEACREALRMDPAQPKAHYLLGIGYGMLGNRDAALKEYRVLEPLDRSLAEELARQWDLK